jgi:predicted esterase
VETQLVRTTTHGRVLVRAASPARGVLVGFHGYMEDAEAQMARLDTIPGAGGWTLVSIQGLHRFYKGRTEAVVSSWMVRQDRETLIADNIAYVDSALASLDARSREVGLKADPTVAPVVFCGFSQGVAMAFRAAVRGGSGAAGIIAVGGDVPPELLADRGSSFPPVLLVRGNRDEWYTGEQMRSDAEALTARGAKVTAATFDGGHEWGEGSSAAAGQFLGAIDPKGSR